MAALQGLSGQHPTENCVLWQGTNLHFHIETFLPASSGMDTLVCIVSHLDSACSPITLPNPKPGMSHPKVPWQLSYAASGDKKQALGHVASLQTCQAVGKDLLRELQAWKRIRFSEWNRLNVARLSDIKMNQSGKLMDMDSRDGCIKLHYNEELVVLLREVSVHA